MNAILERPNDKHSAQEWTLEWQTQAVREAAALLRALKTGGAEEFARRADALNANENTK